MVVMCGDYILSILLYGMDIALLTEKETDLLGMLNCTYKLCHK